MARLVAFKVFLAATALAAASLVQAQAVGLLNGSAEVARAFYEDAHAAFARQNGSVRGATAQKGDGPASEQQTVVFSTTTDVQALADLGVVAKDWARRFPHHAAPTVSTVVFVVREGNPRNVRDWSDLIRPDVQVVLTNPKTCNGGRYAYMGAWGSVREGGGTDAQAAAFVGQLYGQAQLVARGARDAMAAFVQRGEGDVLLAFESDVGTVQKVMGDGKVDVVYPSVSVVAENSVAVVGRTDAAAGGGDLAAAYLDYLYSDEAQEIAAQHAIRPRSEAVLARHADQFKQIPLFTVDKYFGSRELAQKVHFSDGGRFDQLYRPAPGRLAAASREQGAPL